MTAILDPRAKLSVVFCLTSLAIVIQDLVLFAGLLAATVGASLVLGGDWRVLYRLRRLAGLFVALVVIQSVFGGNGQPLLQVGQLSLLTVGGLQRGLALALRIVVIVLASSILLRESSRRLVQALIQWHIPYEIAFMVHLAIRFLPLLQEEMQDAFVALQLRGVDLQTLAWRQKLQVYSFLFMPVLAGVIGKARELSIAMEMKAFRAVPERTSHFQLQLQPLDYAVMMGSLSVFVFGILLVFWI